MKRRTFIAVTNGILAGVVAGLLVLAPLLRAHG